MSAPRVVYYRENPRDSPVIDYYRTMAEIRTIGPKKFRRRALQNDRHGVSCVLFFVGLPGPDLELYEGKSEVSRCI